MKKRIHHINFLVESLPTAVERYETLLQQPVDRIDDLPERGVRTARFRVGESWLVLVEPIGEGVPAEHLRRRGEGFFLLSFGVEDLDAELARLKETGHAARDVEARRGLDGWRVADLDIDRTFGAQLHLTEEGEP